MKTKALAFLTATLVASASVSLYAGDKAGCCMKTASNETKVGMSYAQLNLSAEQETKLKNLEADCAKAGCSKESMEKFQAGAKDILSAEQYAKFKAHCEASAKEKKQS